LDCLIEAQKVWDEVRELDALKNDNSVEQSEDVKRAVLRRYNKNTLYKLNLIEYKFRLCGGSEEIYKIIYDTVGNPDNFINPEQANNIFKNELVPAMKKDLTKIEISWWKIWRR